MTTKPLAVSKLENLKKADQVYLFIRNADQFLEAARVLNESTPFHFFPAFYLAHHSVELALKVHLILLGAKPKDLRDLNHDLQALAEDFEKRAETKGYPFRLGPRDIMAIELEGGHYAGKSFEYPDPNLLSIAPIGIWLSMAETLIREAKSMIGNHT